MSHFIYPPHFRVNALRAMGETQMSRFGQIRFISFSNLLIAAFFFAGPTIHAVDMTEGFDDIATLPSKGWVLRNLSSPLGDSSWFQGNNEDVFDAQAGPPSSYLAANYFNTGPSGTISNWAITPTNTYRNGDTFSFWTRTDTDSTWPDRLEVRLSTNGSSDNVGNTALSVGVFTTRLLEINPTLLPSGYPEVWTQYVITLSGLDVPTSGRIAFRYFVTNGGQNGPNSNYIGIDTLRITTVPEPSTYVLGIVAITLLGLAGRRMQDRRDRAGRSPVA